MELKPGTRLRSVAGTTEVVVVKAPTGDVDLRCGGHEMVDTAAPVGEELEIKPGFDQGADLGKRYVHDASGLEVLCTKAGKGGLSVGGEPLPVKAAKPLPSSD